MLRLHRHRSQAKAGEKLDFRFSAIKALQVPKGWEKLVVSVVSPETGKTLAKTGKAAVRNGGCQWTETLSVENPAKEVEDSLVKLVVSMGSARSGILGEATLNLTEYMSRTDAVPLSLSLSLKKCIHETTLQVKIQCMTPRVKSMEEDSKERDLEKSNENHKDLDESLTFSTNDSGLNSTPEELGSRDTSFSLSESHQSYDSAEGSIASEDVSIRADSLSSENRDTAGSHRAEIFHSKQSSFNSQVSENSRQDFSVKAFREASDGTLEELRVEAKMWERNARKLMLDLDAACEERDCLKIEVEKLKQTLSEQLNADDPRFRSQPNYDFASHLKSSNESNVELVSVLQDLEETVERQKMEISELLGFQSKLVEVEKSLEINGEENRKLKARLEETEESEKDLSAKLKMLERVLVEKNQQIEKGKILNSQAFLDVETEYNTKLLEKEGEIDQLRAKLSDSSTVNNGSDESLIKAVEELKEKVQELERDCTELTEENLDLLFKLKEAKNDPIGMSTSVDFPARTSFDFQLSERNIPEIFGEEIIERDSLISMRESQSLSSAFEAKIEILELNLRLKEEEISSFRRTVSELQKERVQLQEQMEVVLQESDINFKCLNDLQNDLAVLTSSIDSHSSANKILERKSSELETGNLELELHVSKLERENAQFSDLVASLEARIEAVQSELEESKSREIDLNNEIGRLSAESQSSVETLIAECGSLRRLNEELRSEKLSLLDRCSFLEKKLEGSQKGFTDCSKNVEDLERHLSSVLSEFASKEKSFSLEMNALVEENSRHRENFKKKVAEEHKLQQQVGHLERKLSETDKEKERVVPDFMEELLRLRVENKRLEKDFGEAQSKIKQIEIEFNDMEALYEDKVKSLSIDFAASIEDLEKLSTSLENYKASEAKFEDEISKIKSEREKLASLVSEMEDHKSEKLALQEKVFKMEDELVEIGILRIRDSEMAKDLSKVRNENRQYQQKIEQLQALEQNGNRKVSNFTKANTKVNPKYETTKSTNQRRDNRRSQHQKENGAGSESPDASPRNSGETASKIHSLEVQLAKALEENSKHKAQLSKLASEGRKGNTNSPPETAKLVSKVKYERTKSDLESELRDIRERYLSMSLKYAEVEAQREELVMKLKNVNTTKRWFA